LSLGELLRTKSGEYELLAEWHAERAPLDDQHLVASQSMLVVGIVLREIAGAIDAERGEGVLSEPVARQYQAMTTLLVRS
jgi:hypothetical protein